MLWEASKAKNNTKHLKLFEEKNDSLKSLYAIGQPGLNPNCDTKMRLDRRVGN